VAALSIRVGYPSCAPSVYVVHCRSLVWFLYVRLHIERVRGAQFQYFCTWCMVAGYIHTWFLYVVGSRACTYMVFDVRGFQDTFCTWRMVPGHVRTFLHWGYTRICENRENSPFFWRTRKSVKIPNFLTGFFVTPFAPHGSYTLRSTGLLVQNAL